MNNSEVNRIISRIRKAYAYAEGILENPNSTKEDKENAMGVEDSIESLINSMCSYTNAVFDDNFKNANKKRMLDRYNSAADYRTACEEIERRRKIEHDGLIVDIRKADSTCRENGLPEIYGELPQEYKDNTDGLMGEKNRERPGVVETRHAIANWTWDFVLGVTVGMVIDLENLIMNIAQVIWIQSQKYIIN